VLELRSVIRLHLFRILCITGIVFGSLCLIDGCVLEVWKLSFVPQIISAMDRYGPRDFRNYFSALPSSFRQSFCELLSDN